MSKKLELRWWKAASGSGKSFQAEELYKANPGKYKIITKDDLRALFDCGIWNSKAEKFVLLAQDELIKLALSSGYSVLVPDTNLHPKHKERFEEIAHEYSANLICHDLTHLDIDLCIKRDLNRARSVGEAVIRKQYKEYIDKPPISRVYDNNLPKCLIVDLDGTVAKNTSGRGFYDWKRVGEDSPNVPVINTVKSMINYNVDLEIIFMSGRDEICRPETEQWLWDQGFSDYIALYMRPHANFEKDFIVKEKLFMDHIDGKFEVVGAFDDRKSICDLWRRLGIQCYQVSEGDF